MSFLTPALTAGALLIAVPIILHLVMRREPVHVVFPALRFVQARRSTNQTRMKLRHWLLLALRCLAIALLALALARPTLRGAGLLGEGGTGVLAVAMVVDNAPRMGYQTGEGDRLDAAKELGRWLLEQLPSDSQAAVVPRGAERGRPIAKRWGDRDAAQLRLERTGASARDRPLASAIRDAVDLLEEREDDRRELYVLTDLTAAAWDESVREEVAEQLDRIEGLKLQLIDVGGDRVSNRGLGAIELSTDTPVAGEPLVITAPVYSDVGAGDVSGGAREVAVELWIEEQGKPVKRGQSLVEAGGGQAEFALASLGEGVHQGYVTLAGGDPLPADDRRYFTVNVEAPRPVLLVGPNRVSTLFVAEALAPLAGASDEVSPYAVERTQVDKLHATELPGYESVWLLDPPPLEDALWRKLDDYTRAGGSLVVALGRRSRRVAMNRPAVQALLAARLETISREESYLRPTRYTHPVLRPLAAFAEAIPWVDFAVFRHWVVGAMAPDTEVVAPLANGDPAILARAVGRGRSLTLTTSLSDPKNDEPWNLLPTGEDPWPFLALTRTTADWLSGVGERQWNYPAGEPAVLAAPPTAGLTSYVARLPGGETIKASQPSGADIVVAVTDTPGNYRIDFGGGRPATGFSVNSAADAGQLQRLPADELTAALGADRVSIARRRSELARQVDLGRVGRELYPCLIALVAIGMGAEHLLSNRFYGSGS